MKDNNETFKINIVVTGIEEATERIRSFGEAAEKVARNMSIANEELEKMRELVAQLGEEDL